MATPKTEPTDSKSAAFSAQADARAKEARAAADRAAKVAKDAKAAARAAELEAAKLHDAVDPKKDDAGKLELTPSQAKLRLLEAGRSIDPMGALRDTVRDHPYATVGTAAGAGFVLGSSGGMLGHLVGTGASIALTLVKFSRPLAMAAAQFAAGSLAAKKAAGDAVEEKAADIAHEAAHEVASQAAATVNPAAVTQTAPAV